MPMDMFKATNMTSMCDQCRAFLQTYCGPDPSCRQLMTDFQRNMNQTILSMTKAGNGSFVDVSGLIARSVPASTSSLAASVFGLYHSCLAQYQCSLVQMPPGASDAPVLVASNETHVVTIRNTSASFSLTLAYPALNVTMAIRSSMSPSDIQFGLASQWSASMPPKASLDCADICFLTLTFPYSILPLSPAVVAVNGATVSIDKSHTALQTLKVVRVDMAPAMNPTIVQSPTCKRCMEYIDSCYNSPSGCASVLLCASADNGTQTVLNGSFDVASTGLYATRSVNVSSCFTNVTLARAAPYLTATSCFALNMCPQNATLRQILADRSLVAVLTPGMQMFVVSGALTASVSLEFSLLGAYLGKIEYLSLYSSPFVLTSQLQAMLAAWGGVSLSTFQATNASWYIQISYNNYVGPLPTVTITSSASATTSLVSAQSPLPAYQVVPLSAVKFGFPYQANARVPTAAPIPTSPAPLPMYGTIMFPSASQANNTAAMNATTPAMATVCDECQTYLRANCLSDSNCTSLLMSFRAAINANVSSLLANGSLMSAPVPIASVLSGPQTMFATTSLKSMTPFALYFSCMSNYQCALNTTMVNGTLKNVVLSTTPEVHVVTVPNTTVTFNTTISYPSLNVSLVVTNNASSGLNDALQSVWGVSLTPTAVLACELTCNVTLTFPNLAIPLPLPIVTSSFATAAAMRAVLGNQTLTLLPTTMITNTALVLSATCSACVSQFSACAANAACANILSCWRTNASIASTLNALQATPQLLSVNATANATLCFANQTFASASLFAAATSCLLQNKCPVAADLSLAANVTSILANRMIVPTATPAVQTIFLDTTNNVTLQLSLFGSSVGSVPNVAFSSALMVQSTVQALLWGLGQVNATYVMTTPTSWALTLSYTNYIAPLPIITVVGATQNISSVPPSWLYKVVPFNVTAFGFPYTTNSAAVSAPAMPLNAKCQGCASLAAQCAMSAACASIVSCVSDSVTANFTTALAAAALWSPIEYTSVVASCTANVAYSAWYLYAQVMTCNDVNVCPLLSTTASVAAGRMLTPYSSSTKQRIEVNATAGAVLNVKFAIGSTYIGALLNMTSDTAGSMTAADLTRQLQMMFAGIATVNTMTWVDTSRGTWYIAIAFLTYYGPPPTLTVYGSYNATQVLLEESRHFVQVVPYDALSYYPY
ncbi:hypothetical protein SDRG_09075 [Saprolegnia diclina VS20]|uniref:Uncharacterized protein n=1 Tax=Saprolegnia diclina (strain VS20) TaxID=1156394 RepID=T0Q6U5_SAPDV|nr:hypothetical protein SDRG_09075 [Saprolegnia diclina VS20]EQC33569.1 hypothetical protein SDRG_09075 [Saprolegnia diclina VS20]|eukprot:XP_008613209.1 hypothetical protein SDRG_09075 [Saprolegnia diclina VS20]